MGLNDLQDWVPLYALKNISLLSLGNFFTYGSGFLYGVFGAWILGADGFGQLVLIMALVRIASLPLNFRLGSPILKLIRDRLDGETSTRVRDYVRAGLLVQIMAILVFGVGFLALLWMAPMFQDTFLESAVTSLPVSIFQEWVHIFRDWQTALVWFTLAEVLQVGRKFVGSVFEAYEKFGFRVFYAIWSSICRDLMVIVFMYFGGVQAACLGYLIGEFLIWGFLVFVSFLIWRRQLFEALLDENFSFWTTTYELYRNTRSQYVSSLLNKPYTQLTDLIIGAYVSPSGVGYYNIALKFKQIFQVIIQPVKTYLYPRFVEKWKREDRQEFYYTLRKFFYQMTPTFVFCAILIMVTAPWLVPWLYSPEFEPSIPLVFILMPFFALKNVFNLFTEMSFVVSRQVALVRESLVVLFVALPVNIFLIAKFGYLGATWGLAVKIMLLSMYRGIFFYRNFGWKWIKPR